MDYKELFLIIKKLDSELRHYKKPIPKIIVTFDELYDIRIKNEKLRNASRKLFLDGHYAQAVEMAYKCVNNTIKKISNEKSRDGADLMTYVFSEKNPIIKLNDLNTKSELDEQKGFMQIFAGCMTGIRNPRAHEDEWADTEENALSLISFADFLLQKIGNLNIY